MGARTGEQPALAAGRSVQDYIDETPTQNDGSHVATAPMTAMQWRIWWLAAAGKFFEGLVVFMIGVALPLIAKEFGISGVQHGLVSAATLFGILIGAAGLGGLADRYGRRRMFIIEMFVFVAFLCLLVASPNFPSLVVCLFGLGVALGCDYPTAHLMISESIQSAARGRLVLSAIGFQSLGALCGAGVGFLMLKNLPEIEAWRLMYATAIAPALITALYRLTVTESGSWLLLHGRGDQAAREVQRLLQRDPSYRREIRLAVPAVRAAEGGYGALFTGRNLRATVLASVPWFVQDLSTYGVGIFTPTIIASTVGHKAAYVRNLADLFSNDEMAARGAAMIDVLLIAGIIAAVLLTDRVGRIRLQVIGFIGCAAGLLIASFSADASGHLQMLPLFAGFMLFNFMTNMGPNAQTYLLAGEVFPMHIRARGAGFAAAFAKMWAVMTAFLFPVLLANIGTRALLYILAATSLAGAAITWGFRIETTGANLELIGDLDGCAQGRLEERNGHLGRRVDGINERSAR
jgi:MFS family permease